MKHILSLILLVVSLNSQAFFFDPTITVEDDKGTTKITLDVHKVGPTAPTIIYGHSCSGVNEAYKTNMEWVRVLKSWGYNVVIPDSFGPRGYNTVCDAPGKKVSPRTRVYDMIATAQWIKQQPWHSGKIGYIGFSHGGGTAENLSKVQDSGVDAIVEYYPKCQKVNRPSFVPVQIHLGAEDDWDDPKLCDPYIGRDNYEVYLYQGATHAFERNAPDRTYKGHQLRYNRVAAEQAEQRTREFFRKYVK